jgi:regulator of sigma E protease
MLGGVTVNFILAIIIYIGLAYSYGSSSISTDSIKDGYLISNPVLLDSGFKTGDKILTVDGEKLSTYSELRKSIIGSTTYQVDRDGDIIEINLPVDFLGKLSSSDDVSSFEFRMPFIIQSVSEESLNKDYDLRKGDIIVSLNDQEIKYADQITKLLKENSNRTIEVELLRDSFRLKKTLNVDENGNLGIFHGATVKDMVDLGYIEVIQNSYSLLESIPVGINKFVSFTGFYFEQFVAIFNPSTGAYKGLGGFIAIGNIFPSSWDWQSFWSTTAFLSIMLGVLNLLPIPALDGGYAMFLMYEMISGRKPSDKFMETVQVIGFIILLSLVIFANGNDIYKLFNFIV